MRFCLIVHNPPNLIEKVTQGAAGLLVAWQILAGEIIAGRGALSCE